MEPLKVRPLLQLATWSAATLPHPVSASSPHSHSVQMCAPILSSSGQQAPGWAWRKRQVGGGRGEARSPGLAHRGLVLPRARGGGGDHIQGAPHTAELPVGSH